MDKATSALVDRFLRNFKHGRICTDDGSDLTKEFFKLIETIQSQK